MTAEKLGGIPWHYYVFGGLVAGAAAVLVLSSGGDDNPETREAINPPPERP